MKSTNALISTPSRLTSISPQGDLLQELGVRKNKLREVDRSHSVCYDYIKKQTKVVTYH